MPAKRKKRAKANELAPKKARHDDGSEEEKAKLRVYGEDGSTSQEFDVIIQQPYSLSFTLPNVDPKLIKLDGIAIRVPRDHAGGLRLELQLPPPHLNNIPGTTGSQETQSAGEREVHLRADLVPPTAALDLETPYLSKCEDDTKSGFLKLPKEIKDMIYSEVFVCKDSRGIDPWRPLEASRCAALLRTCRQVHYEGREFLYSQNVFSISRDPRSRGGYWESEWDDLGYETMVQFFMTIGAANASLLRYVKLRISDASPSAMPYTSAERRRYVNDVDLWIILQHLAKIEGLRKIKVMFDVRRREQGRELELKFFDKLMKIKADEVELRGGYNEDTPPKIGREMLNRCYRAMLRDPDPMYDSESDPEYVDGRD